MAVAAVLHAVDIPDWLSAARSEPPQSDYAKKLDAADDALFYAQDDAQSIEKVFEFMPILLGARGLERGTQGWDGRLALNRENRRPLDESYLNPNWDAGICLPNTDQTLVNPRRVQIKRRYRSGHPRHSLRSYTEAGVAVVYADRAGFIDPAQIVDSCRNEIQPLETIPPGTELLSTEQLDHITERIHEQMTRIVNNA